MKMLIADDELQICLGMKAAIDWQEIGIDEVFTAQDGLEALELCMEHRPEIVLTDIAMPGLTGIELGKRLLDMYQPVRIVVFSGYADFTYAQQALQIHALEYYLKPVEIDTLKQKVCEICAEIAAEREHDSKITRYSKLECMEEIRSALLRETELDADALLSKLQIVTELPLENDGFHMCAMKADLPEDSSPEKALLYAQKLLQQELIEIRDIAMISICKMLIIIVDRPKNTAYSEWHQAIREGLRALNTKSRKHIGCTFSLVFGGWTKFGDMVEAYELCAALFRERLFQGHEAILYRTDFERVAEREYPRSNDSLMRECILNFQPETLLDMLTELFEEIRGKHICDSVYIYELTIGLRNLLFRVLDEMDIDENVLKEAAAWRVSRPQKFVSAADYCEWIQKLYSEVLTHLNSVIGSSDNMCVRATIYIRAHYSEQCRLEDLASHLGISQNYFASKFRREMGISFTEYLNCVRVEAAKHLLDFTSNSMGEIAEATGFSDAGYFASVFKRICGMSPKQYKKHK